MAGRRKAGDEHPAVLASRYEKSLAEEEKEPTNAELMKIARRYMLWLLKNPEKAAPNYVRIVSAVMKLSEGGGKTELPGKAGGMRSQVKAIEADSLGGMVSAGANENEDGKGEGK